MMLGAINPINVNVIKDRITTTQSDPSKIQTFATKNQRPLKRLILLKRGITYTINPNCTDYMAMIKKYAPYAIGAILLYYVISKK
jgi:hypothetical protein